ncbi:MAG: MoxR family ATPase [Gammaproteobacteria bacterium]|nr:MoxR family ATPase [Gammaproteobacteria bacterium]MBU2177928.1 MoxR family ATPase [Gammaproteobacteria bacterium]MBU2224299.1 MoxR family ATPase [Gammaproteobacteria bacterium]MBU2278876.1 MoxR family ATPase [Gammaproteobacteria bacterium]MBU2427636.1 MoxR family ATPase [Gammaproteobacteria bacterium]
MHTEIQQVEQQLNRIILGKPQQIRLALTCLLAEGHLLLEDLPGMGKTTLAHALAESLGLSYRRVQFTSDLLPADLTGFSIFDTRSQQFSFQPGPVFSQVLLADEINRASPKTQSALLEAMEEHQVSIDGETRPLPAPFFVIATQNPLFHSGTNALPESQLDRFLLRLSLGFPDRDAELQLLQQDSSASQHTVVPALLSTEALISLQQQIPRQQISNEVLGYVLDLVGHSRKRSDMLPLSPRAAKGLVRAAKAYAFLQQRSYVTADDIQAVFVAVAEHRLQPRQQQQFAGLAQQLLLETPCLV